MINLFPDGFKRALKHAPDGKWRDAMFDSIYAHQERGTIVREVTEGATKRLMEATAVAVPTYVTADAAGADPGTAATAAGAAAAATAIVQSAESLITRRRNSALASAVRDATLQWIAKLAAAMTPDERPAAESNSLLAWTRRLASAGEWSTAPDDLLEELARRLQPTAVDVDDDELAAALFRADGALRDASRSSAAYAPAVAALRALIVAADPTDATRAAAQADASAETEAMEIPDREWIAARLAELGTQSGELRRELDETLRGAEARTRAVEEKRLRDERKDQIAAERRARIQRGEATPAEHEAQARYEAQQRREMNDYLEQVRSKLADLRERESRGVATPEGLRDKARYEDVEALIAEVMERSPPAEER